MIQRGSQELDEGRSSVVSSLDQHSSQDAQDSEQQEAKLPFVELFEQEEFGPVHLGLAVGRVPEPVGTFSLQTF